MKAGLNGIALIAVTSLFVVAGCQHTDLPQRLEGASSFQFVPRVAPEMTARLADPSAPREPVDVLVPAEPIPPLVNPQYPGAVLGQVRVPVTIGVHVTVDATGRVSQIGPSMLVFSTVAEQAAEFRTAVEEALAQWRFTPAEIQHLVPGTGGPTQADYWIATRKQKTDYAFDLSFTFSVTGDVLPTGLK